MTKANFGRTITALRSTSLFLAAWAAAPGFGAELPDVPPPAGGAAKTVEPPAFRLQLELSDGSRLFGLPLATNLAVSNEISRLSVALRLVETVTFSNSSQATLAFANGDRIAGRLETESLEVQTVLGRLKVPLAEIRRIRVLSAAKGQADLVLHYSFNDEDQEGVKDASGHGYDGKFTGVRWSREGKEGGGCVVSGGTDEISVSNSDQLPKDEFTLCAWVKRSNPNTPSGGGYHATFFGVRAKGEVFGLESDGRLYLCGQDGMRQAGEGKVADLKWHHVAAATKAGKATLYLDGEPCGEVDIGQTKSWAPGLSVGSIGDRIGYPFVGALDEVMIFKRALAPEEIAALGQSNR